MPISQRVHDQAVEASSQVVAPLDVPSRNPLIRPETSDISRWLFLGALKRLGQPVATLPPEYLNLRRALRLLSDRARQENLQTGQVMLILKQAWAAIAQPDAKSDGAANDEVLHSVISLFIDEYYSQETGHLGAPGSQRPLPSKDCSPSE